MARMTRQQMADQLYMTGLRDLLQTNKAFRRFVFTTFNLVGIYSTTFDKGSDRQTSFNEGRRSLGLSVLELLRAADPQAIAHIEAIRLELDAAQSVPEEPDEDEPA